MKILFNGIPSALLSTAAEDYDNPREMFVILIEEDNKTMP